MTNADRADAEAFEPSIAICTALPKELAACRLVLDSALPVNSDSVEDGNQYYRGSMPSRAGGKPHQVVLTSLAKMGNNVATGAVTQMTRSFPSIEYILMVGIAGGVPDPQNTRDHVRLGDVVVSNEKSVLQYDQIKKASNADEIRDNSAKPGATLDPLRINTHTSCLFAYQLLSRKKMYRNFCAEGLVAAAKALESDFDLELFSLKPHLRRAEHLPRFRRPPPETVCYTLRKTKKSRFITRLTRGGKIIPQEVWVELTNKCIEEVPGKSTVGVVTGREVEVEFAPGSGVNDCIIVSGKAANGLRSQERILAPYARLEHPNPRVRREWLDDLIRGELLDQEATSQWRDTLEADDHAVAVIAVYHACERSVSFFFANASAVLSITDPSEHDWQEILPRKGAKNSNISNRGWATALELHARLTNQEKPMEIQPEAFWNESLDAPNIELLSLGAYLFVLARDPIPADLQDGVAAIVCRILDESRFTGETRLLFRAAASLLGRLKSKADVKMREHMFEKAFAAVTENHSIWLEVCELTLQLDRFEEPKEKITRFINVLGKLASLLPLETSEYCELLAWVRCIEDHLPTWSWPHLWAVPDKGVIMT